MHTFWGALSSAILALVMIPNCPRPPRTAWYSSQFWSSEHVTTSPLPVWHIQTHFKFVWVTIFKMQFLSSKIYQYFTSKPERQYTRMNFLLDIPRLWDGGNRTYADSYNESRVRPFNQGLISREWIYVPCN